MDRSTAIFVAGTSLAVGLFLALAAVYLGQDYVSDAQDALVKALWVELGVCMTVTFCAVLKLLSYDPPSDKPLGQEVD